MLEITYKTAQEANPEVKIFDNYEEFLQGQFLEVSVFPDHYIIVKAILDGKEIDLTDSTINGLFNYLNTL